MIKLSSDFELDRYGLHVRFARVDDAEFIHKLRTASKTAPYMHIEGCTVETQREWLMNYIKREANGEEYYIIFEREGEPIGIQRLCHFDGVKFHCSSWAFKENIPSYYGIAGALISREIAFDILGLEEEESWRDGIVVTNKNVIMFMKLLGWKQTGVHNDGEFDMITGVLTKEAFLKNKLKVLRFIPKTMQQS